jgi:Ca2+-binding RTX toxin-like protein
VVGGSGSDTISGSSVAAGNSLVFEFSAANLSSADMLVGGAGANTLMLTTAGTVAATAFSHVSGIGTIELANGTNDINLSNVAAAPNKTETVVGGAGNDTINASIVAVGNSLILDGGAGANTFVFGAANLTANDTISGGGASGDTLMFTTAGTIAATAFSHVSGVGTIELANGTNDINLSNVASAPNRTETVVGGAGNDTINAAVVAAGNTVVFDAGGNTTMTGGAGSNEFAFSAAGTNTITNFGALATNEIALSNAGFALGLSGATATPKALPADLFVSNAAGAFTATTQRFAYGTANGELFYSASGATATEHLVATLSGHPALAASQLFFIS